MHAPVHFAVNIPFLYRLAFVIGMFSPGKCDVQFGKAFLIDEDQDRYYGKPFFSGFVHQAFEFPGCKQQFAVAFGIMVVVCPKPVFRYVQVLHKKLPVEESAISINKAGLPFPDGFDLSAGKYKTCSEFLQKEILKVGFLVFDAYGLRERGHYFNQVAKIGRKSL